MEATNAQQFYFEDQQPFTNDHTPLFIGVYKHDSILQHNTHLNITRLSTSQGNDLRNETT